MSNPCTLCGKQRIDGKTWEVRTKTSVVAYGLTVCPDPACQKQVDKAIAERRAKSELLIKERAEAKLARIKLLSQN